MAQHILESIQDIARKIRDGQFTYEGETVMACDQGETYHTK